MTTTTDTLVTQAERRSAYTAGLRALADALDTNAELPLPYDGDVARLSIFTATKAECAAYARVLHGRADKNVDDNDVYGFQLLGAIHGLKVRVYAHRSQVCDRIVTGTREVTREVPDPEALAAVPTVTVVETVEDVTWECRPLLAEAEPVAS